MLISLPSQRYSQTKVDHEAIEDECMTKGRLGASEGGLVLRCIKYNALPL